MRLILTTILLISLTNILYSQTTSDLKRELKKAFRQSKPDFESKGVYSLSNIWMTCNQDSSFYFCDTISLINHVNGYADTVCCEYIKWNFFRKSEFKLNYSLICIEPPKVIAKIVGDVYKVSYKIDNDRLYLSLSENNNTIIIFQVLGLDFIKLRSGNDAYKLTLLRQNKTKK